MIYTFILLDKADAFELRQRLRAEHRTYVGEVADRIAFAGALVGDNGETRVGSLLAIDFPDRQAADEWIRDEPFTRGGLYSSIQVLAFLNFWPQKAGFPVAR